ncbi:hypothetical protein BDU57DRAFT_518867 [Ampelomyces quisqualis]|uniref:Myb-like domain-containing protein n=1 Tax=Ampelomyces quisqualis TaxID=50730 RepID=A0A6A5QK32_AMPQU|nr:hypothetical protein BDU57DRAFT_518867 [Ampelomyces quisqualis]
MSAEEGSAAGNDKTQAPKPAAAFTSSFINKNTTGKKFAPKAARRRPGAAPPAVAASRASAPEPTPPVSEAQPTQPEPEPSSTHETTIAALPTPAAAPTRDPAPAVVEPLLAPASTGTEQHAGAEQTTATSASIQPTQGLQDGPDTGRVAERRHTEPLQGDDTSPTDALGGTSRLESAQPESSAPVQLEQETVATTTGQQAVAGEGSPQPIDAANLQAQPLEDIAAQPASRTQQWTAVNRPPVEEEDEVAPAPARKARAPPKPRVGRRKAVTATEPQQPEQQEIADGGEVQPARPRPSAQSRGKRKADKGTLEDGVDVPAPAKRARKSRRAKNNEGTANAEAGDEEGEARAEEGEEPVVRRKPRQPRRKKKPAIEVEPGGEGEDGQEPAQPKRKGRPPREPTPSDAEDQEIDPEVTFMDSIASRNIRVGKLSDREKAMRQIDWVAVRQRRREEDSRPITTKEAREAADKVILEQAPQTDGVRYELVNGQITMIHSSTTVNREAEADVEIGNYETIEEQDLTTRITSRSFLKNNKRFPNDFILPGQGKRWTRDDTELFYQGLQNFGTDFQMISHMFPGATRRSIKLKFTREERDDPQRVRDALLGKSTIVEGWDNFIQVSRMEEQQFADADEIKREMAAEEAEMREKIAAALAETAERNRQQEVAGVLNVDGSNDPNKENGKGKKKRKGKERQVTFHEEAGVEIVGTVDDDATWGQV